MLEHPGNLAAGVEVVIAVALAAIVVMGALLAWMVWLCVAQLVPLLHDLVAEVRRIRLLAEGDGG